MYREVWNIKQGGLENHSDSYCLVRTVGIENFGVDVQINFSELFCNKIM